MLVDVLEEGDVVDVDVDVDVDDVGTVLVVVLDVVVDAIVVLVGVGSGDGLGIGRPDNRASTTSRMNDARASAPAAVRCTESIYEAASLAAGVRAQSASTHRCWVAHHCRAASE